MRPKIAVTLGDPAGIGPELAARIAHDSDVRVLADLLIVGRKAILAAGARAAGLPLPEVELLECGPEGALIPPGQPSAQSGAQAGAFISAAANLCLKGEAQAMVTAPVSKEHLNLGGYNYAGHTEMLGQMCGVRPVMLLAGSLLKVSLLSTHIPLRQAAELVIPEKVEYTCRLTWQWLRRYWGYENPRLAMAAFNPHAGENGLLGQEEKTVLEPLIAALAGQGLNIQGPFSADTLFWRAVNKKEFDAVICMYHDQGLIPFKMLHFKDGVNVSLGLPFIRTSPDHGTAFELAGRGQADSGSMKEALLLAARMAGR
jgi:4-hydroxythreonine-4-phosphate dehydrogenase